MALFQRLATGIQSFIAKKSQRHLYMSLQKSMCQTNLRKGTISYSKHEQKPANGTMTTGRFHAGSMSAANTANNSTIGLCSDKDKDGNGDPLHPIFTTKPDAMTVWVKFKGNVKDHPNEQPRLFLLTDKVQDPEKDDYKKNVIARAANAQIKSNNFAWQELNIPFEYANKNTPKGVLVTISTNAEAGKASSDKKNLDVIYVDDIANDIQLRAEISTV